MTKDIERILEANYVVHNYDVELDEEKDTYVLQIETMSFQDNQDLGEIIKLKNKIRSMVNKSYKIEFNFKFTT